MANIITEEYTLPSKGLVYNKKFDPTFTIKSMTLADELKRLSPSNNAYKHMSEIIDNCLDDYFNSKINNNFSNTQAINFNQEDFNNNNNNINNNNRISNYFAENKNKSKNKRKNEVLSIKNLQEKKKRKISIFT